MTLMKIFVILLSLLLCYVLIIFSNNFTGNLNLIGPILVLSLLSRSRYSPATKSPIIS